MTLSTEIEIFVKKKKRSKGLFIVESALSLSSQFTGTPLKYLETNNSNTT